MNKHNYLMALAMNSKVGTLRLENASIPVKITEIESENDGYSSPMTTFKCLVVNDDEIAYHKRQTPPDYARYTAADVAATMQAHHAIMDAKRFEIDRVIFNAPATIVIWADGTKTVVKCQEGDVYHKETGLALCFAKKALGNKGNFNDVFHKWIPEEEEANVNFTVPTGYPFTPGLAEAARKLIENLERAQRQRMKEQV